jgi:predicted ester cyclase
VLDARAADDSVTVGDQRCAVRQSNLDLVHRMHADLLASRDPARVERYFAAQFVSHNQPPGLPSGVAGVRAFVEMFAAALDDLTVTVDVALADRDLVALRTTTRGVHRGPLLGIAPSGRRVAIDGTDIVRIAEGRIVEHWGLTNSVGLLEQVGTRLALRWLATRVARAAADAAACRVTGSRRRSRQQ